MARGRRSTATARTEGGALTRSTEVEPPPRGLTTVIATVGCAALLVVAGAGWLIATRRVPDTDVGDILGAVVIVTLGGRVVLPLRIGPTRHPQPLTDLSLMLGLMMLPGAWLVPVVVVSTAAAKSLARLPAARIAFAVARDVLTVALAALAGAAVGLPAPYATADVSWSTLGRLGVVAVAVIAADELLNLPVAVLDSGRRVRDVLADRAAVRLGTAAARLAFAIAAGSLMRYNARLALATPMLALGLHLHYANRLEQRADRLAWQRLARIVDAFGASDETAVHHAAVIGAAELFGCDEVDLVLRPSTGEAVLLRARDGAVTYAGPPADAPDNPGTVVVADLEHRDHEGVDVTTVRLPTGQFALTMSDFVDTGARGEHPQISGELRLRFRHPVTLTPRDRYMLHALAAALGTAVRKASAVTEAARIATAGAHASNHDALTGLANRRHLLESGAAESPDSADGLIGLAVIDLTGFKQINDALGQAVGDRVLIAVAARLASGAAAGDLVARLSGDEFAALFRRLATPAEAVARTRDLIAALAEPLVIGDVRLDISAVAGVAIDGPAAGVEELLRRADVAMNHAKRFGQPISIYVSARDTADVGRLALSAELARAVANREFTTAFQPIVDLTSGDMIAAEALARWPHPQLGKLSPHSFLDGIERSGLLAAFTEQILDQALSGARTWRAAGFALPVAVNISPRSLLDPHFPPRIPAALERHGLPPEALTIELTETLTLSHLEVVDDVLHTLRALGVTLALDDFGTGFSSLATVARVPVHELKIDRSFVAGLDGITEGAIVRSTIELGRGLGLIVVAEGIENEEQRRQLWALGCPAGQGHLFSRAVDAAHLVARLRRGHDGVPGRLVAPLHTGGKVIRLPVQRRSIGLRLRDDRG